MFVKDLLELEIFSKRFGAKFPQSWLEIIRLTKNKVEEGL